MLTRAALSIVQPRVAASTIWQSIDALEEYVAASALVLVMLGSPRYFKSANCLRELQAARRR